jgi:hypothetical protein
MTSAMNASQVTRSQWVRAWASCVEVGGVAGAGVALGQLVGDRALEAAADFAGGAVVGVRELVSV